MKISKLFHWLYACVMFLPLLVVPIFAIYTINHEPTPLVIERNEKVQIDFNQLSIDGQFNVISSWNWNNERVNVSFNDNIATVVALNNFDNPDYTIFFYQDLFNNSIRGHKLLVSFYGNFYANFNLDSSYKIGFQGIGGGSRFFSLDSDFHQVIIQNDSPVNGTYRANLLLQVNKCLTGMSWWFSDFQVFDLTQMFGVGNEPTIDEFNSLFPNYYYDYTLSENLLITRGVVQYNDTDIGSQYLYALYHTTDKYFNFDDVLNLGAITNWLDSNVFSGSTPIGFTIVWHYLDYWLIVSIFWLCFDVLIYVPQLAHRWLDKASLE